MVDRTPRLVALADCPPQPWRNGGGTTREVLAGPRAADWQWRVSVADIAADGPFSAWPGVERWFAVMEGAGVELSWHGHRVRLHPGDAPLRFDGAAPPDCRLLAGQTRDLNLMLRQATGRLNGVVAAHPWQPDAPVAGLYTAVAGTLQADDTITPLAAGTLAWFDEAPAVLTFHPAPGSRAAAWWIAATPVPTQETSP
jgi:environmental stress-induced protein Ves